MLEGMGIQIIWGMAKLANHYTHLASAPINYNYKSLYISIIRSNRTIGLYIWVLRLVISPLSCVECCYFY